MVRVLGVMAVVFVGALSGNAHAPIPKEATPAIQYFPTVVDTKWCYACGDHKLTLYLFSVSGAARGVVAYDSHNPISPESRPHGCQRCSGEYASTPLPNRARSRFSTGFESRGRPQFIP